MILFVVLGLLTTISISDTCPYGQYFQFVQKQSLDSYPFIDDPYRHPTAQYLQKVQQNLNNKLRVCAISYKDKSKREYNIKNFNSRQDAESEGWIVTHQGRCGACSTTKDLFVYLTKDLTRPVRKCGIKHFMSKNKLWKCIKQLGFTNECTQVWYWNTLNTKKNCGLVCMWATLTKEPFVINGELNGCLQCDEQISGPIFKYESGRTRRNSGIKSQIDRPSDQIYNLTHCYY